MPVELGGGSGGGRGTSCEQGGDEGSRARRDGCLGLNHRVMSWLDVDLVRPIEGDVTVVETVDFAGGGFFLRALLSRVWELEVCV